MGKSISTEPAHDKQIVKPVVMYREVVCQLCGSHYSEQLDYCPYYGCHQTKFMVP